MPELNTALVVLLLSVGVFTLAAAICDLRFRKIPNRMTAPMCLAGIVYQVAFFGIDGLWASLLGFAAGFGTNFGVKAGKPYQANAAATGSFPQ